MALSQPFRVWVLQSRFELLLCLFAAGVGEHDAVHIASLDMLWRMMSSLHFLSFLHPSYWALSSPSFAAWISLLHIRSIDYTQLGDHFQDLLTDLRDDKTCAQQLLDRASCHSMLGTAEQHSIDNLHRICGRNQTTVRGLHWGTVATCVPIAVIVVCAFAHDPSI